MRFPLSLLCLFLTTRPGLLVPRHPFSEALMQITRTSVGDRFFLWFHPAPSRHNPPLFEHVLTPKLLGELSHRPHSQVFRRRSLL